MIVPGRRRVDRRAARHVEVGAVVQLPDVQDRVQPHAVRGGDGPVRRMGEVAPARTGRAPAPTGAPAAAGATRAPPRRRGRRLGLRPGHQHRLQLGLLALLRRREALALRGDLALRRQLSAACSAASRAAVRSGRRRLLRRPPRRHRRRGPPLQLRDLAGDRLHLHAPGRRAPPAVPPARRRRRPGSASIEAPPTRSAAASTTSARSPPWTEWRRVDDAAPRLRARDQARRAGFSSARLLRSPPRHHQPRGVALQRAQPAPARERHLQVALERGHGARRRAGNRAFKTRTSPAGSDAFGSAERPHRTCDRW